MSGITTLPAVEISYSYPQPSAVVIQAPAGSGVQGIVFAGVGAGNLTSFERSALQPILSKRSVLKRVLVRSNRLGSGRVVANDAYDIMGMIPADNLNRKRRASF